DFDEWLGGHHGSYRPHPHMDQRPIARNHHTGAGTAVLHANVIVLRVVAKPGEFPVESIAADKIFGEDKLLAANFSQRVPGVGGLGRERESEFDRRSGSLMIDDQKIVIVNPGLNRPSTAIYQVVLDGHDRMILLQPNRLCILIAVSGTTIRLLGEFNPVSAA